MGKVIMQGVMSLDGFIADPSDGVGPLFDWYDNGPVALFGSDPTRPFHVSEASAAYLRGIWPTIGGGVIGRRLFDLTNGWEGRPAVGDAVFVVTHRPPTDWDFPDAPFTFVTGGVAEATARARAFSGERNTSVMAGNVGGQALAAGLVDEVCVDLVPVVFGAGRRFFGDFADSPLLLGDPEIVQGDRVTHLRYRVGK